MKKLLALLFIFSCVTDVSLASQFGGYDAGSINSQYMRELRTHEAMTRARNKNNAIISTKTAPKTQEQVTNSPIKSIVFVNNNSITSDTLLNVVQNKIDKPMTAENIAAIRKDIMKFYQDNGFYSALVMITSQDPQKGEIVFEVNEGGRNSIEIQN